MVYDEETNTFKRNNTAVSYVAADEEFPYHDMYAVWQKLYKVTVKKVVEGLAADKDINFTFTPTGVTPSDDFTLKDGAEKEYGYEYEFVAHRAGCSGR